MAWQQLMLWDFGGAWGIRQIEHSGGTTTWGYGSDLIACLDALADLWTGPRCRECRDPLCGEWMPAVQNEMTSRQLCFECNFWTNRLSETGPSVVYADGCRYDIEPDKPAGHGGFTGHGGAEFRIRFHDGREVVTRNLWARGIVPPHFRERLPDNAVFVSRGQGNYFGEASAL